MTAAGIDASELIKTILARVTAAGVAIGEGKKPAVAAGRPYVVAFFDSGTVGNQTLKSRDGWSLLCNFQCAGLTPESARFAVRKVREAVQGLHLHAFAGRAVQKPVHEVARMDRDDDADPPLYVQIDEWRLRLT